MERKKLRIAIIGTRGYPYVYSGYESFVKEVSERLVKRNIEVTVYCHKNLFKVRPAFVNGIRLVYLYTIEKKSVSQLLHSLQAMVHAVLNGNQIILAVNTANGPLGVISRTFGRKTAINTDGLEWLRPKWKGLGAKYFYWASKMATRFYDVLIADSAEMQRIYKQEFGTESVLIAYGANIFFSKNTEVVRRWDLTSGGYYLIVGRLIPDNNSDIIVKEFISSGSCKKLVVVGDVPYRDEYAAKVKQTSDSRVIFTGYITDQEDLSELYAHSFAYIHGHQYGGTNPTMLTAMACGCAVLALDTPFTREMCDGERHAIYFDKSTGNLRSLIDRLEEDNAIMDHLRETAHDRIYEAYTWDKITDQYVQLFQNMDKQ